MSGNVAGRGIAVTSLKVNVSAVERSSSQLLKLSNKSKLSNEGSAERCNIEDKATYSDWSL